MITSVSRASVRLPSEMLLPERIAEEKLPCESSASERLAFDRNAAFQEEENVLIGLSLDTLLEQIVLCDKRLALRTYDQKHLYEAYASYP